MTNDKFADLESFTSGYEDLAIETLRWEIGHDPRNLEAHSTLISFLDRRGETAALLEACRALVALVPGHPHAVHHLAAHGEMPVPDRAADGYVTRLFDAYAERFDAHLQELGYRAPAAAAALAGRLLGDRGGLDVVDLGCGTGLCGGWLRARARRLDGVDLSPRMLEQASATGAYDALHAAEATAWLDAAPAGSVDLVVATDVLVYFGALEPVAAGLARVLRADGIAILSLERRDDDAAPGWELQRNGRYRHSPAYVARVATAAGLGIAVLEETTLRHEADVPVPGLLVGMRAP